MSDLQKYINRRKSLDSNFAEGYPFEAIHFIDYPLKKGLRQL